MMQTVIWFKIFLSNTNNFQTNLFDPKMRLKQVLPLVIVDLGVMSMKGYSVLHIFLEPEPHHHMQFRVITRTSLFLREYSQRILSLTYKMSLFWGRVLPLSWRYSRRILSLTYRVSLLLGGVRPLYKGYSQGILRFADRMSIFEEGSYPSARDIISVFNASPTERILLKQNLKKN